MQAAAMRGRGSNRAARAANVPFAKIEAVALVDRACRPRRRSSRCGSDGKIWLDNLRLDVAFAVQVSLCQSPMCRRSFSSVPSAGSSGQLYERAGTELSEVEKTPRSTAAVKQGRGQRRWTGGRAPVVFATFSSA